MLIPQTISAEEQRKKLEEKLNYRVELQKLIHESNPNYQTNRAVIYDLCKNDFTYFADNFLFIPDPEADEQENKDLPFLLYDYQDFSAKEIIKAINNGYDMPVEKSRKMGMSLLCIAVIVWGWNFHRWDALIGSEKASKVDTRGDQGSLLEKARYMIRNCPSWLIPKLDQKKWDKSMLLVHPENLAKIKGDSNSVSYGRGDRAKVTLLDEFTAWDSTDRQAWASCSSTSKCRIALSTPNHKGRNCYYYLVVKNAKDKGLPYLRLHWSLNPIFSEGATIKEDGSITSPWYENECKRATTPQEIFQELDINYDSTAVGLVFSNFDLEKNVVENLEYNPSLPLYVSWDFGLDSTALLWYQVDDKNHTINVIDEYVNSGLTLEGSDIYHYISICDAKPYQSAIHYGDPHSGNNRNLAARGQSNGSILTRAGIRFKKFNKVPKINERIAAGRNMMDRLRISDRCILFIDCLSQWQFKRQASGNSAGVVPEHNIHSHIGDSYTYFAWGYQEKKQSQTNIVKKNYSRTLSGVML